MEVGCPACRRQLSVPQSAPGAMLQCPYCGGMFQLPASMPQPAATGAFTSPGFTPHAPQPASQEFVAPGVSLSRARGTRRRKNDNGMLLAMGVLFAAVVVALVGVGIWLSKRGGESSASLSPTGLAAQQASELVRQEMQLPSGVKYSAPEEQVEKLPNNRYVVNGFLDMPSRVGDVYLRQKWTAQVSQLVDGGWRLERLEVDGRTVSANSDNSDRPSRFGERSRWLTGEGGGFSSGGSYASGPDHSTRWAVDRVTESIRESAKLRSTLVVWLIDRSMSARSQQQDFLKSVESALGELKGGDSLSMAVVSFGSDVKFPLDTPSRDAAEVRTALESIEEDATGKEQTFTAISQAAEKFGSFRTEKNGYVLFVVVSDEMGDDEGQLDATVNLIKQQQIAVHTIGVSAPFGISVAEAQKGLEGGSAGSVRQGPESRHSEMISLASIGGVAVELDSGFGPFNLSRLCQESGGRYLACQDYGVAAGSRYLSVSWGGNVSSKPVFEASVMRKYAPDYVSEAEYQKILASNKACHALHEAAKLPFAEALQSANTVFPKRDEASFKRSLDTAQRDSAKFEPKLITLHETLKKGEVDRPKLTRLRWQAGYDLAMGRALAARVKTEGYNAMLAKIKAAGNFTKPGADTWVLSESETIGAGSTFEKMLAQSREYLQRVVKDHPGTPWAYLAERELQIKAGWEWTEQ